MHKKTHASKAARPSKTPAAHILKIEVPIEAVPIIKSIASYLNTTPEIYALAALYCHLECDVDYVRRESEKTIIELQGRVL